MTSTDEAFAAITSQTKTLADRIVLRCLLIRLENAFPGLLAGLERDAEKYFAQIFENGAATPEIEAELRTAVARLLDNPISRPS